jgi:photosystem II stability/assembly factor-like uncharacterized protein
MCVVVAARYRLLSRDGGASWSRVDAAPEDPWLMAVSCPSASVCVAVGSSKIGDPQNAMYSRNGGRIWTKAATVPGATWDSVACPSVSACVAVGVDATGAGITARTVDGGATWTPGVLPADTSRLSGTDCASPDRCVAVAQHQIVFSRDGGASWR